MIFLGLNKINDVSIVIMDARSAQTHIQGNMESNQS